MSVKPASSQIDFLERKYVLEAISRLSDINQINIPSSSKYDLVYKGLRYPPNKVIALALSLMKDENINPNNLSKLQEPIYTKALIRCGFTLTPKKKDVHLSLGSAFSQILNFQISYSSKNTPEMQQRGVLIRQGVPDILRNEIERLEPIFSNAGFSCSIKGSDSIGNKTVSPWVRIFDPIMSPSATEGWYVVIHFSSDGKRVYLTLGRGATILKDGGLRDVPDTELAEQNEWARKVISKKFSTAKNFEEKIVLGGNKLSNQFEKATTFAKCYTMENFTEEEFHHDLQLICEFLIPLYELERQGKNPYLELPEAADLVEVIEQITNPRKKSGRGQGRGLTHPERTAVELRAMTVCREELVKRLALPKLKICRQTIHLISLGILTE